MARLVIQADVDLRDIERTLARVPDLLEQEPVLEIRLGSTVIAGTMAEAVQFLRAYFSQQQRPHP